MGIQAYLTRLALNGSLFQINLKNHSRSIPPTNKQLRKMSVSAMNHVISASRVLTDMSKTTTTRVILKTLPHKNYLVGPGGLRTKFWPLQA
ncbi:MAG: hypothetical protein Q9185_001186 [Variospora sp. 1 TL-2023]